MLVLTMEESGKSKYSLFKKSTSIYPSHIAVYLDEDFNHIGFYDFKINSFKENIINFFFFF